MMIVQRHYEIIRKFVCKVSLHIDPENWSLLATELDKYIPGISVLPVSIYIYGLLHP